MQTTTIVAPKVSRAVGAGLTSIGGYTPTGAIGAIITGIVLCNIANVQINVTLVLYDGTNTTNLFLARPCGVGDSIIVGGDIFKGTLVNGWFVRVQSNVAASVDASMFVVETT